MYLVITSVEKVLLYLRRHLANTNLWILPYENRICGADNFSGSVYALEMLWSELSSSQVYRVGYRQLLKSLARLFISFFRRGINREHSLALLDNSPLAEMLGRHIDFHRLEPAIVEGHLHALCITALGYTSGDNLCFYQGDDAIESWKSSNRCGLKCKINYDHVLASLALPGIFPAVRINREYFGDGALRQTAPMSAALHLGADRILVIGVAGRRTTRQAVTHSPSIGQVMGQLLASAFIDSLSEDIVMLERLNAFSKRLTREEQLEMKVRPVKLLVIEPTVKFDVLASQYTKYLPQSMRLLLRMTGANLSAGDSNLVSYILFEKEFCCALIQHGYEDAMRQSQAILEFMDEAAPL